MQRKEGTKKEFQKNKRPRIDREQEKKKSQKHLLQADWTVWDILKPIQSHHSKLWNQLFVIPESKLYKNDAERISKVSNNNKNNTIYEAFAKEYHIDVPHGCSEVGNDVPVETNLGQVVHIGIKDVTKDGVVFEPGSYKEHFITRNNLQSYKKFIDFSFKGTIPARIIERTKDRTVVDIFSPMIEEFILPRANRPWSQNLLENQVVVQVKDLRLVNGGYIGNAVIPNISEWLGEEYTIPAFVPGSQIVLNTTEDFEDWIGKDVETFITSYSLQPRQGSAGLVVSRKAYLKHQGNLNLKALFGWWCDDDEKWEDFSKHEYEGQVTGIINSAKKCGIFVEIPLLNITGMVPMDADRLVEYPAGKEVTVRFKTFEEEMDYNQTAGQYQHRTPFEIVDGAIKEVNVKPILELV